MGVRRFLVVGFIFILFVRGEKEREMMFFELFRRIRLELRRLSFRIWLKMLDRGFFLVWIDLSKIEFSI